MKGDRFRNNGVLLLRPVMRITKKAFPWAGSHHSVRHTHSVKRPLCTRILPRCLAAATIFLHNVIKIRWSDLQTAFVAIRL